MSTYNSKIKKRVKEELGLQYIIEIHFAGRKYIQVCDKDGNNVSYYEIGDVLKEVKDKRMLNYFRDIYETKPSKVVY